MTDRDSDRPPLPEPLRAWLGIRGHQARVIRFVQTVAGRTVQQSTVARWANGDRHPDAATVCLLTMLANPERGAAALRAQGAKAGEWSFYVEELNP